MPFEALALQSPIIRQRDTRYLQGGNFFGTEPVGPPPREPLPIDFAPRDLGASQGSAPGTGPPLTLKLNVGKASKSASKSPVGEI